MSAEGVVVPDPAALEGKGERFANLPANLPEPAGRLVGRTADLASLVELAGEHRVVTITGPGGVGKTRTLIELGRTLTPDFLDGLSFVALADVTDPADFLPALAEALDVKEAEGRQCRVPAIRSRGATRDRRADRGSGRGLRSGGGHRQRVLR